MNLFRTIFSVLYSVWVFTIFTAFMFILLPLIVIPFLIGEKYGWLGYKGIWLWSWIFDKLTGIRYHLINQHYIQKDTSYIFVSNHTSFLDIPGLCLLIPGEFRPLAKKELTKLPVFGWIVKSASITVDRGNHSSRRDSLAKLVEVIHNGISPLIFAEGTQNRTTELLQPFKDGAFKLAIDSKTDIIPITIIGAGKLMPPGRANVLPGKIKVIAGKPIPVAPFANDMAALKTQTYEAMITMMKENA